MQKQAVPTPPEPTSVVSPTPAPAAVPLPRAQELQAETRPAGDPPTAQQARDGYLPGTISIKIKPMAAPVRLTLQKESQPITQERLQEAWDQLLESWSTASPEKYDVLRGHEVKLEDNDTFAIMATNRNFVRDLRPIQTAMLEYLRKQLACVNLQCRVEVHVEEQEAKVYQPSEKYEAMLKEHPQLALLRKHFAEIDY